MVIVWKYFTGFSKYTGSQCWNRQIQWPWLDYDNNDDDENNDYDDDVIDDDDDDDDDNDDYDDDSDDDDDDVDHENFEAKSYSLDIVLFFLPIQGPEILLCQAPPVQA